MNGSVDPDEMAHYESSHLNLPCLQRYLKLVCRDEMVINNKSGSIKINGYIFKALILDQEIFNTSHLGLLFKLFTNFEQVCPRMLYVRMDLIQLRFKKKVTTSSLVGHFVLPPRERRKRDRIDSRGDEREELGRKENE